MSYYRAIPIPNTIYCKIIRISDLAGDNELTADEKIMIALDDEVKKLSKLLYELYVPSKIAVNQIICCDEGNEMCQPCRNRERLAMTLYDVQDCLEKRGYVLK